MSSGIFNGPSENEEVNHPGDSANLGGVDFDPTTAAVPVAGPLPRKPSNWFGLKPMELVAMFVVSLLLLAASYRGWWPIGNAEAWGFVTGGVCVWLVVREHLWNWPIGLANNIFFFVLFFRSRLYADMGLQVIYFGLGVYGWLNWLFGGENRTVLRISRATRIEWLALATAIPVCAWGLREILLIAKGAAPFWDSLTTVLSLAAQYLLCRKRFENWWFWIAADLIYIPLYLSRALPLTAALYTVFLGMCLIGVREWRRSLKKGEA